MTPSLEGWPTKAKEAPSPHEVRISPLDTNPVFQSLGGNLKTYKVKSLKKNSDRVISSESEGFTTAVQILRIWKWKQNV